MTDSLYKGAGVHHIAIGVRNLAEVKAFYTDILKMTRVYFEFENITVEKMEGLLRTSPVIYEDA